MAGYRRMVPFLSEEQTVNNTIAFALVGAVILLLGAVGSLDAQDADNRQALYCSMVETYQNTNGEHGWPDYNGNAKEVCQ